jgi:hypothetical protein
VAWTVARFFFRGCSFSIVSANSHGALQKEKKRKRKRRKKTALVEYEYEAQC